MSETNSRDGASLGIAARKEAGQPVDLETITNDLEFLDYREVAKEEFYVWKSKFNFFDRRMARSWDNPAVKCDDEIGDPPKKKRLFKIYGPIESTYDGRKISFISTIDDTKDDRIDLVSKAYFIFDVESGKEILCLSYVQETVLKEGAQGGRWVGSPGVSMIETNLSKSPDFASEFKGIGVYLFRKLLDNFNRRAERGDKFIDMVSQVQPESGWSARGGMLGDRRWREIFMPILDEYGYKKEKHGDVDDFGGSDVYYVKKYGLVE